MARKMGAKQKEIYEFIKSQIKAKGYPPSVREICTAVNLSSTSTVHGHLSRLEKKGFLRRDPTKPRAIELLIEPVITKEMIDIPIVGNVTAGLPILAVENIEETFSLPINYVSSNEELFMLRVSGDSMIEAGIHNGDLAIIAKASSATNGEIIVALIEDHATIKTFYKEENHIRLQPENSTMDPIIVDTCSVIGKLKGLYRRY